MSTNAYVAPALVFAGVVVSSVVTWFIARLKNSGTIDTSEAGVLWEERRLLTQELREEVKELRQANTDMGKLNERQATIIATQSKKITELEKRLAKWEVK